MRYIKRGYPNGVSNKCDAIPKAATSNLGVDLHDIVLWIAEEQRPVAPSCKPQGGRGMPVGQPRSRVQWDRHPMRAPDFSAAK
jgi:hypothetical protein